MDDADAAYGQHLDVNGRSRRGFNVESARCCQMETTPRVVKTEPAAHCSRWERIRHLPFDAEELEGLKDHYLAAHATVQGVRESTSRSGRIRQTARVRNGYRRVDSFRKDGLARTLENLAAVNSELILIVSTCQ